MSDSARRIHGSHLLYALALCGTLVGCDGSGHLAAMDLGGSTSIAHGAIVVDHGVVTLHAHGAPDATIDDAGNLRIDDKPVTTDATQRELLLGYYRGAQAERAHLFAISKANAAATVQSLKGAARLVANGDTARNDHAVASRPQQAQQAIHGKLCLDTAAIKAAQDRLATQLAAFKPYASIVGASDVADCRSDAKD